MEDTIIYELRCKLNDYGYDYHLYDIKIVKKEVLIETQFSTIYEVHKRRCRWFSQWILVKIIEDSNQVQKFIASNEFLKLR